MAVYVLDANVWIGFIHYTPMDIFVSLWGDLVEMVSDGTVIVPEEILREVRSDKFRAAFVEHNLDSRFLNSYADRHCALADVANLCKGNRPKGADVELVAHALEIKNSGRLAVVVSEEKSSNGAVPPKVPDLCAPFNIPCIKKWDFIRELGRRY